MSPRPKRLEFHAVVKNAKKVAKDLTMDEVFEYILYEEEVYDHPRFRALVKAVAGKPRWNKRVRRIAGQIGADLNAPFGVVFLAGKFAITRRSFQLPR